MDGFDLARRFEGHRRLLHEVAGRMLGSAVEADDAVQETWLRLGRIDPQEIDNLGGWLRTVITRICLDMLRTRRSRREEPLGEAGLDSLAGRAGDPERDALLAEAVGRALLVVLDRLDPAERVAFVLHDMFAVPFAEIGPALGRTPGAAKKLASRARQKAHAPAALPDDELARHRDVVAAFLRATRAGDLDAVLALLAQDVVRRADAVALPAGAPRELRGAAAVAGGTAEFGHRAGSAGLALVDGLPGLVVAPGGRLTAVLTIDVVDGMITRYEVVADPARRSG